MCPEVLLPGPSVVVDKALAGHGWPAPDWNDQSMTRGHTVDAKRLIGAAALVAGSLSWLVRPAAASLPAQAFNASRAPMTAVLNGHNEVTAAGAPDQGDPDGTGLGA